LADLRWGVNARIFHSAIETAVAQFGYEVIYFKDDVALLQQLAEPQPATGTLIQRIIDLQEAGGKYAPTAQTTLDWLASQYLVPALPDTAVPLNTQFQNNIQLLGYTFSEAEFQPGQALCVTLYWSTDTAVPTDLTVFLHLAAADGFVVSQRDNPPAFGYAPTSSWQPGQILADSHCLQIPPQLPAGQVHFNLGLYDPSSGTRIPIQLSKQPVTDDALSLPPFTVSDHDE
jgi:hypothetical protein